MVKLKICGVKRLEDVKLMNKYMPDYVGFVFADSPRKVSYDLSKTLKDNLNPEIKTVGVFVDAEISEILKLFEDNIIDIAQLHGQESQDYIDELKENTDNKLEIIKAVEIKSDKDLKKLDYNADYLLLDSGKGSGKTFPWELINQKISRKFFLAGGINISNIDEAILKFQPYAIDLSSGVEKDGFKDEELIKEIMERISWVKEDMENMVDSTFLKH